MPNIGIFFNPRTDWGWTRVKLLKNGFWEAISFYILNWNIPPLVFFKQSITRDKKHLIKLCYNEILSVISLETLQRKYSFGKTLPFYIQNIQKVTKTNPPNILLIKLKINIHYFCFPVCNFFTIKIEHCGEKNIVENNQNPLCTQVNMRNSYILKVSLYIQEEKWTILLRVWTNVLCIHK